MGDHFARPRIAVSICAMIFGFSACLGAAARGDSFAPPSGIVTTTASLQDVLAKARKADGSDISYRSRVVDGQVQAWGMKGTYRSIEAGSNYVSRVDFGIVSWQDGRVDGQPWRQDENGMVIQLHDARNAQDVEWDSMTLARFAEHPGPTTRLLGETQGPGGAYVVEAHQSHGRPMWLFIDKKTFLVTRTEIPYVGERDFYVFSSFHTSGPYTDPQQVRFSDGQTRNDMVFQLTTKYNAPVTQADLAMPSSNDKLVRFPDGTNVVTLPASVVNREGHSVYVPDQSYHSIGSNGDMNSDAYIAHMAGDPHILTRASVGGHDYEFMLDSGAPGIYMSSDAVAKLGLKSFGPQQITGSGGWVNSYAVVPEIRVGPITLTNVIAYVLPDWQYEPDPGVGAIGLIGYDFIANAVLTIDFDKGTVVATNPFLFVPPADAVAVPASLDDGVPHVSMQIGQSTADRVVVDTGSSQCFILPRFANAHPDDVKDQGKGVDITRARLGGVDWMSGSYIQMYNSLGGGNTQERVTEVKSLSLAGIQLQDWFMEELVAPQGAADEIGRDEDALLGYSFLKYFTVYLDYPQNQIFLLPNASFRKGGR